MDTAQPGLAAENVALDNAAEAFKAFTTGVPVSQPRDESGRFAPLTPAEEASEEAEEIEADDAQPEGEAEAAEDGAEHETEEAAADEAQPADDVPMPTSWSKEDEALWGALPAEAKAKIFAREAQRDQAVNAKFQEAANVRKQAEGLLTEAQANRQQYAQAIEQVLSLVRAEEPNPQSFIDETGQFDGNAYAWAKAQHDQTQKLVSDLQAQRQELAAQEAAEEARAFAEAEAAYRPKLFQAIPDLADATKGPALIQEISRYAVDSGLDPGILPKASSLEVHLLWKAMQYDRQQAAKAKVQAKPAPKPATPAVKPGVSSPRSAFEKAKQQKVMERLHAEGSVEAGAALFRNIFSKAR